LIFSLLFFRSVLLQVQKRKTFFCVRGRRKAYQIKKYKWKRTVRASFEKGPRRGREKGRKDLSKKKQKQKQKNI